MCLVDSKFSHAYSDMSLLFNILATAFIIKLIKSEEKGMLLAEFEKYRFGFDIDKSANSFMILTVLSIPFLIFLIIALLMKNFYLLIAILLIVIINFITYRNSKKQILTKKGKEEYLKVLGLKNYIKDYSIIEKRDMEEVILWDDYLIYATAFGIPNKITDKFAEGFLNANVNLQKINRLLYK